MNYYGERIGIKMNKRPIVIVDADALIAQTNPDDIHHQKTIEVSNILISLEAQVLYPVTAILEATTHMQRVLNSNVNAYGTAQLMIEPSSQVIEVNKQTLEEALKFFNPQSSKKNTLFDCIIAAIAQEKHADAIFSFDKFYLKSGFKLASDLRV